jgi:hypothetical protein
MKINSENIIFIAFGLVSLILIGIAIYLIIKAKRKSTCSTSNLSGACPDGQSCVSGTCISNSTCSTSNLSGTCPDGQSCGVDGTCITNPSCGTSKIPCSQGQACVEISGLTGSNFTEAVSNSKADGSYRSDDGSSTLYLCMSQTI